MSSSVGNKEIFAKNLSYYLDRHEKDQREVADIVGVAPSTFNEWVKAKKYPRIDKIEILANYFGIQKSDLIEKKVTDNEEDNEVIEKLINRIKTDEKFANNVKLLSELSPERYDSITQLLTTLSK